MPEAEISGTFSGVDRDPLLVHTGPPITPHGVRAEMPTELK